MKTRYMIWYFIIFVIHTFCWYYALVFCSIYKNSSSGWLFGCLISLGMDLLVMQIISPVVKGILRALIRTYPTK